MNIFYKNSLVALFMISSALLAVFYTPKIMLADQGSFTEIKDLIPNSFGDWAEDKSTMPIQISPEVQLKLDRIYSQLITRTYINEKTGKRVMLSIAYGKDQRSDMAVHYPEVCYPAQGFEVLENISFPIITTYGEIPARRLQTKLNLRYEPVTYWTTIGDHVSLGGLEKRLLELRYGFDGLIPDGLLFRVSTISTDSKSAFEEQDQFIRDLLLAIPSNMVSRLIGNPEFLVRHPRR